MTNNSLNQTIDEPYCIAIKLMPIVLYQILMPLYFVFCTIGHALCLVSFWRQLKTESAYAFQVFLTVSQTLDVLSFCFYAVTWYWFGGLAAHPARWFTTCYGCVWITVLFSVPLSEALVTTTLLFTVAMAADRAYALADPIKHTTINNKRHQSAACAICIIIGFGSSVFNSFKRGVKLSDDGTYATPFTEFSASTWALALERLRDVIRASATLILLGLNICVVILYRRKFVKSAPLANQSEKMRKRRENERMLIVLSFFQSFFMLCFMADIIWGHVAILAYPGFQSTCRGTFLLMLGDAFMRVFIMCDFGVMLIADRRFRAMIYEVTPRWFQKLVARGGVAPANDVVVPAVVQVL